MGATFGYLYSYYFFLFWLPTYMMRARGFTEAETKLSALPFVLGALANLTGGYARDAAVRRWGPKWGARVVCIAGLATASVSAFAAFISVNKYVALMWLAFCYGGITFQQPTVWATCVDIGKRYAGAVAGCMNTAGGMGGLASSLIFGYVVQRTGSYDAVLLSMAGVLILGAGLWLRTDATETLEVSGPQTEQPALA
jgi:nitrate/nitrite transporter NarK